MRGHKVVNYEKTELPDYVVELLVMGVCSLFLKAGSVEKEEKLDISYVTAVSYTHLTCRAGLGQR